MIIINKKNGSAHTILKKVFENSSKDFKSKFTIQVDSDKHFETQIIQSEEEKAEQENEKQKTNIDENQ